MKYVVGFLLFGVGVSSIVLCLAARAQFRALAEQAATPNLDEYPLVTLLMPDGDPSSAGSATQLAKKVRLRIYAVGGIGLLIAIAGVTVLVSSRRRHAIHADGDPP